MKTFTTLVFLVCSAAVGLSQKKTVPNEVSGRIIGGYEAWPHSLPYQVYLTMHGLINNSYKVWSCSGSIISKHYILTSGRCVDHTNQVIVRMGVHNASSHENTHVQMATMEIHIHPDYKYETNNRIKNDIALLNMKLGIPFDNYIQPIGLPSQQDIDDMESFAGEIARSSGWGLTDGITPNSQSSVLKYFDAEIIKNSECKKTFFNIDTSVLCTGGSANVGICQGDVGGPLVVGSKLIGISSYWAINCISGYPSVYTRVSSYIEWIVENSDVVIV